MTSTPRRSNELFRAARESRGLSRERLADAVNRLDPRGPQHSMTSQTVGRIEQGIVRWPNAARRRALRAVLGAQTDAEIGLADPRRRDGGATTGEGIRPSDAAGHAGDGA